jgi:hypothetical protein
VHVGPDAVADVLTDDPQLITFPPGSVIVMIVLLNDAWMWTCPDGTFFRSRRRCFVARLRSATWSRSPYFVALRRAPTVRFGPRRCRAFVFVR